MDHTAPSGPPELKPPQQRWRSADMRVAQSVEEIMELRKQQTRRVMTYVIVTTFCVSSVYLIVWGEAEAVSLAYGGLVGIAGSIMGFYFGAKQTGQ